ncbi:MAG: DUF5686 family protein, partial [Hymenobacteraceae bacterium]|nr:DUF5686 family protein [Hymenobacteraceae bacterium]MDX5395343.1 DUF5686 family protein [Hymenobacteraceae bacterium]MDX5511394.1 DUF5686 family protein [Hymenobacteraceae bacterium]
LPRVNRYEGLRLGIGAHTNDKVSEFFSVGGYIAYGFKDRGLKYGSDLLLNLYKPSQVQLSFTQFEDLKEAGGVRFPFTQAGSLVGRGMLLHNFDKVTHYSSTLSLRTLKYLDLKLSLQQEFKRNVSGYTFVSTQNDVTTETGNFRFTEAVVSMRYAFREKVAEMLNQRISLGTKYPVVMLQYTQGLQGVLQGEFAYHKFDAQVVKSVTNRVLGTTTLQLQGGLVLGEVPFTNLYNGQGNYSKRYKVYTGQGFETMYINEFISDRYASVHFKHDFGKLLLKTPHFDPTLSVVTNVGFGSLSNPEQHRNISFNTMEKGFYESGILINNLLKSQFSAIGVGAFYRYGPYAHPDFNKNLYFKLSTSIAF